MEEREAPEGKGSSGGSGRRREGKGRGEEEGDRARRASGRWVPRAERGGERKEGSGGRILRDSVAVARGWAGPSGGPRERER